MVNVILDAKNQSFKLCSVDGIDVVSPKLLSLIYYLFMLLCLHTIISVSSFSLSFSLSISRSLSLPLYQHIFLTKCL